MLNRKNPTPSRKDLPAVVCPLCKSSNVDGRIYGEHGRFECKACGAIFTIEAIPKS